MLNGFNPDKNTIVVSSGTDINQFEAWYAALGGELYIESYETTFLDHMSNDLFTGVKTPVYVFTFDQEFCLTEFVRIHEISLVNHATAMDLNVDMYLNGRPDPYDSEDTRTIADLHNLHNEDRHDKRTDEQKAEDAAFKEKIKEMKKNDQVTGESFSPKSNQSKVHVETVNVTDNADGTQTIDGVEAVKTEAGDYEITRQQIKAFEAKVKADKIAKSIMSDSAKLAELDHAVERAARIKAELEQATQIANKTK